VTHLEFPGGPVAIDTTRVWSQLQDWLDLDTSRRASVYRDSLGYCCRLTWDAESKRDPGGSCARSNLGIGDAVANALQTEQFRAVAS